MEKIDFKKKFKQFFSASEKQITFTMIPPLKYLTIEGKGHPENNQSFMDKIGAMYGMAYTLKFMFKEAGNQPNGYFDFVIPPMGTRWWSKDMIFSEKNKEEWCWQLTIMMADYLTPAHLDEARALLKQKKDSNQYLNDIQLETITEGETALMLHVGPYDTVGDTYMKMLKLIEDDRKESYGKCHEIYLNDPRRTAPEKLKTVIRIMCR